MATRSLWWSVVLATLVSACGGGGGGSNPPAPPADTTAPTVVSVTPASSATNVPVSGIKMTLTFSEAINCSALPSDAVVLTGPAGSVSGTLACASPEVTFTPTDKLFYASSYTATQRGVADSSGNRSLPLTVSFTTAKPAVTGAKVYTANMLGMNPEANMGNAVSVMDPVAGAVTRQIDFGSKPGYQVSYGRLAIDPATATVYLAPMAGFALYRLDLETDAPLPFIILDTKEQPTFIHGMQGLALSEKAVCLALDRRGFVGYYWQNKLRCYDRFTQEEVFKSQNDFVADETRTPTSLLYAPERKKFYVVSAARSAFFIESPDACCGRDGYAPGTIGRVTEIDAETYRVERTFSVGSAPMAADLDRTGGKLYVANTGDRTLSVIDLAKGTVMTTALPSFSGQYQRPASLTLDREKGRVYLADDVAQVIVLDLATLQEINRITLGDGATPGNTALLSGKLYVANYKKNVWYRSNTVAIVDRDTLAVTKKIATMSGSTNPEFRDNMPWGLAVYDPNQ